MRALLLVSICLLCFVAACGAANSDKGAPAADTSASNDRSTDAALAPDAPTSDSAAIQDRVVITTSLELQVPGVRDAYSQTVAAVRSLGGYVAEGHFTGNKREPAKLRLRIPAPRHDDLLGVLRDIEGARVRREASNAREVTAEYSDLESRIRNLQRSEAQYQALFERAGSISDVVQVSARLDQVRGQIESAQGKLKLLNDSTDYATLNLTLTQEVPATSGLARPDQVFGDAVEASQVLALLFIDAAIAALVFAAWVVPTVVAGILAWRLLGRRLKAIGSRIVSW